MPFAGVAVVCLATLATLSVLTVPSAHPLASRDGLQPHSDMTTRLPVSLEAVASASIGASERRFWPVRHGASLVAEGGDIHSTFTASGAALHVAHGTLDLSLAVVGHGQRLERVAGASPTGAASQILYQ